jgi:glycosyltransferase involved in cell wall biosynthesis
VGPGPGDVMDPTKSEGGLPANTVGMPALSVIIPAFNEAGYIRATLARLAAAVQHLKAVADADVEILVVDNASTDRTAEIAQSAGATALHEPEHHVGRVRNAGAARSIACIKPTG